MKHASIKTKQKIVIFKSTDHLLCAEECQRPAESVFWSSNIE